MKHIKLFEDLTPQQIYRQKVLDIKKNKEIEVPFVKEVDEKTIRVEYNGWYIDFYFDSKGRVAYIDNPWHHNIPEWYGLKVNFNEIKSWIRRKEDYNKGEFFDVYRILDREAKKYNL
jgi:hypothetical protein